MLICDGILLIACSILKTVSALQRICDMNETINTRSLSTLTNENYLPRSNSGLILAVSAPMFSYSTSRPSSQKTVSSVSSSGKSAKDMEWLSDWRFADPLKVKDSSTGRLFFAGLSNKASLTGGCGWWLLIEDTVLSYGSAPVKLSFPSPIGFEYEALLLGLEDALLKGLRHVLVHSPNALILDRVTASSRMHHFHTVD